MLQSRVTSGNSQDERLSTAVHLITQRVQYEAYKYEGTVLSVRVVTPNKAMRDRKPVVAIVNAVLGYGLPPLVRVAAYCGRTVVTVNTYFAVS